MLHSKNNLGPRVLRVTYSNHLITEDLPFHCFILVLDTTAKLTYLIILIIPCWFSQCIYIYISVNAIVRLPYPRSRDRLGQETFLAPSADNQTHNYDTECSNHPSFPSTLRSNGSSRGKIKCYAIYANLPANAIVRLPDLWSGDSQGQMFLASSADNQTCNIAIYI